MAKVVNFVGQLYKVECKRDGGGRLTIDFGRDAFEEILKVQRFFVDANFSVAMALAPLDQRIQEAHQEEPHTEAPSDLE